MSHENRTVVQNPLTFAEEIARRQRAGERIISLGLGEPDFDTPAHIASAAQLSIGEGETKYSSAGGLPELRQAIQAKLQADGIERSVDSVVVTAGAKAGLFVALRAVLEAGDHVINITPCYVSNRPLIRIAQDTAVVHDVDLLEGSFRLDVKKIAQVLKHDPKLLFLSFPNNPTGAVLADADLDDLAEVMHGSDCMILSDEIYGDLTLDGPHKSPARHPALADRTIVVGGPSKSHAMTGWRIGWLTAPGETASACRHVNLQVQTCVPPFVQRSGVAALNLPAPHTTAFVDRIRRRLDLVDDLFVGPLGLRRSPVAGGFFVFVEFGDSRGEAWSDALLRETGVAVLGGGSFGSSYGSWVRISLAVGDDELREALTLMRNFLEHSQ